ncbi:MAG: helix-turn-helix transcriptional regulator [Gammaproteobacteria bacterium]|nr:helix-turn-helix transcriptional regulator [Gammaproteobacteria bacterium]
MSDNENAYLTTRELADLLRIKERKVYDLVATGQIPCSRAMGKLLFPRKAVEAWINGEDTGSTGGTGKPRPAVLLGSYEPLLEWALRESGCGLATLLDGSMDGLERFARGEGVAAGMHVYDAAHDSWNIDLVRARLVDAPAALIEFTWRERGLIVAHGREGETPGLSMLKGRRVVPRQAGAGSQVLLEQLLEQAGVSASSVSWTEVARTESDAAMAVLEGKADATLGLRAIASKLKLGFVPILRERYDLLVDRAAWFDPPLQALMTFCRTPAFAEKAAEFAGYDVSGLGTVRFNAGR